MTLCLYVKVKEVDLYSAFIVVPHTQGAKVTEGHMSYRFWHIQRQRMA